MGVYHAMVLVDLLALSLGVGIIFVALLSWERSGIRWLRDLSFVLVAGTVLLMLDLLRIWEVTTGWPPGLPGRIVLATLSGVGNLLIAIAIPVFVEGITPLPPNLARRVIGITGTVLLALAGVLDELFDASVFHVLNDLLMASLLVPAAVIMAIGYRGIAEPETRRVVKRMMWLTIANLLLSRGQLVAMGVLAIAPELRRVRVVQVAYFLGILAVVLVYAVRHLFRPSGTPDVLPSPEFAERYAISNRERDIIAMIVQGHANRVIGERLFISDRTVKNHISSIYRKTGAANKVQLLNMVRNHPESRGGPGAQVRGPAAPGGSEAQLVARSKT